jgi:hypothetical protein
MSTTPLLGSSQRPKERFKLPEFDGDKKKWREWHLKALYKIQVDHDMMPTDGEKTWHLFGKLTGRAATVASPWMMPSSSKDYRTVTPPLDLLKRLEAAFGDPGRAVRARNRLREMKQGKRGFGAYLSEFQQALVDAGATTWTDQQKIDNVEAGAHVDLMKAVAPIPGKPTSFEERMAYYQQVWDQMVILDSSYKNGKKAEKRKDSPPPAREDPDAMEWSKTAHAGTKPQRPRDATKEKWRREGKCLSCGSDEHFIKDCPTGPYAKKQPSGKKTPRTAKSSKTRSRRNDEDNTTEEDEEDENESGSEPVKE